MKTKNYIRIFVFSMVCISLFFCKRGEVIIQSDLTGIVTDALTSEPIQEAGVKLSPSNNTTSTGSDGTYLFSNITPGEYEIEVSKIGYDTISTNVYVHEAKTNTANFSLEGITVMDIDLNYYQVVTIGTQTWMAENLKTTHYANGDEIPDGTGVGDYSGETNPKYWFAYNDDLNNVSTYGRLYTGYTVTDSRNVCPDGWHVPSNDEWITLRDFLGGGAGGKLKEVGLTHWLSPNTAATNETGFTALPGGVCYLHVGLIFEGMGSRGVWWSSTDWGQSTANLYNWGIINSSGSLSGLWDGKSNGNSIRCVKD